MEKALKIKPQPGNTDFNILAEAYNDLVDIHNELIDRILGLEAKVDILLADFNHKYTNENGLLRRIQELEKKA